LKLHATAVIKGLLLGKTEDDQDAFGPPTPADLEAGLNHLNEIKSEHAC